MKAVWDLDYDMHTDSCFKRPCCPECKAPIGECEDGKYRCFSCGEVVGVDDPAMKAWFSERKETKTEMEDCGDAEPIEIDGKKIKLGCGGKKCVEVHYMRNPVTLEWQVMGGKCTKCGMNFIV